MCFFNSSLPRLGDVQLTCSEADAEEAMAKARGAVMTARQKRPVPYLDDKIITSWNGLMVTSPPPPRSAEKETANVFLVSFYLIVLCCLFF